MKKISLLLLALIIPLCAYAKHEQPEKYYQELWCNANKGQLEVVLKDSTRIDCLTDKYAIEFDFSRKWAEAIGQSLHYSYMTGKKAGIVLILESPMEEKYYNRLIPLGEKYGIELFKMYAPSMKKY